MGQLMHDALGIGLAATQLGVMHRAARLPRRPRRAVAALVNPVLEWASDEPRPLEEGCLSLPGVLVEVERPIHVRVRARTSTASELMIEAVRARGARDPARDGPPRRRADPRPHHARPAQAGDARAARGDGGRAPRRRRRQRVRTVYLGTSDFAAAVLERLADSAHRPALVVTRPDRPRGRGRRLRRRRSPTRARARARLIQPERLHDAGARSSGSPPPQPMRSCVCAYGVLIKEPLLSDYELLNVHPSLLPRWRGAAPIERAIMAGDERDRRLDHAPRPPGSTRARSACRSASRSAPTTTTARSRRAGASSAATCSCARSTSARRSPSRTRPA